MTGMAPQPGCPAELSEFNRLAALPSEGTRPAKSRWGHLARERCHHARVGLHFPCRKLTVYIVLIPMWVDFCAGPDQQRDHFVIAFSLGLYSCGITPGVQRPSQRGSAVTFVLRVDRRAAFQQQ